MNILRRIAVILLGLVFGSLLYLNVALISFIFTFGQPTTVKKALKDSGAYNHVFESVIKQASANPELRNKIPVDNPAIKSAAANGASGWQKLAEQFIDGSYNWLEGKTAKPNFVLDINAVINQFVQDLSVNLAANLKTLPTCAPQNTPQEFDPFNATCLPPGTNAAELPALIQKQIAGDGSKKSEPLTADSFDKDSGSQKPTFERLSWLPRLYQSRHFLLLTSIIATLITGFLIFVISKDHLQGLRRVAHALLTVGILLIISVIIVAFLGKANKGLGPDQAVLSNVLLPILITLSAYMNKIVLTIGVIYSVIAIGIYIFLKRHNPVTHPKA